MKNCECDKCEHCKSYKLDTRKAFHCKHPNYEHINNYFKEHKLQKMIGFIGYSKSHSDVVMNKTTPRWCPKKLNNN